MQYYTQSLKNSSWGVEKLSFSLSLVLIFFCTFIIKPSVRELISVTLGMYCGINLFVFSTAPFCHEEKESVKQTCTSNCAVIHLCAANSLPLSVVIVSYFAVS